MKQSDWAILLQHNHWITIGFRSRRLNICARCSGTVLGFFWLIALGSLIELTFFKNLIFQYQIFISVIIAMPAIFDWLTQSYGLRKSSNSIRITTGFLQGVAVSLLVITIASFFQKFAILMIICGTILTFGIIGKKLSVK